MRFTFTLTEAEAERLEGLRRVRGDRSRAETLRFMIALADPKTGALAELTESLKVEVDPSTRTVMRADPGVSHESDGTASQPASSGVVERHEASPGATDDGYKVQLGPTRPKYGDMLIDKRKGRK